MIRFINVYKAYFPSYYILTNINLHIQSADFVFITGPSGVGKTTFFKLIYREEIPSQGEILVSGFNVKVIPQRRLPFLRRKIGVVFQDFKLLPYLTVFENIALVLRILRYPSSYIKRRVCELAQRLELEEKLNLKVNTLSTGEKQRVNLARAIAHQPPILLADEPTSNLDARRSQQVIELLKELHKQGTTVIVATHSEKLTELIPTARIMKLEGGEIKEI
ncbi:MAG: ATP-binding cassette domain-containing protein [Candidatus Desulfofervidaceae bacterium]|nr:ATP-binding cassette domain-containing protein [Candidatus Desulfofervidaceae bacterium]